MNCTGAIFAYKGWRYKKLSSGDETRTPEIVVSPIFAACTKDPAARRSRLSSEILRTTSSTKKKKPTRLTISQSNVPGEYHHIPRDLDRRDADKCGFCALTVTLVYSRVSWLSTSSTRLLLDDRDDYGLLAPESGNVIVFDFVGQPHSSRHHTWRNPITSPLSPNSSKHVIHTINASV